MIVKVLETLKANVIQKRIIKPKNDARSILFFNYPYQALEEVEIMFEDISPEDFTASTPVRFSIINKGNGNEESSYEYIGQDAFAEGYAGFVPFSNSSWIVGDTAYDSGKKQYLSLSGTQQKITAEFQKEMANTVQEFITINNLILESDYYQEKNPGIF